MNIESYAPINNNIAFVLPAINATSNVFAIRGLRSLYFALEGVISRFPYLRYGLAIILIFIGIKMQKKPAGKILNEKSRLPNSYGRRLLK